MNRTILAIAVLIAAVTSFTSCNKSSKEVSLFSAVVTAKNIDGQCVFQVDDDTRVYPTNIKGSAFTEETRAITELAAEAGTTDLKDGQQVEVMWIEKILTKKAEELVDGKQYGTDPVAIASDWITTAEDGYVTFHIMTYLGDGIEPHVVELITGTNPDNPYELEFRHDAKGNTYGDTNEGVVAFNIRDILPTTPGDVELTINYLSFDGPKSFKLTAKVK